MALNSLFCADVPLSNYSLTHESLNLKKKIAPQHSLPVCSATQVMINKLFSKSILCAVDLMGTIVDFALKPFSHKHICKHLKWLKLFSAITGLALTLWMKIGKTRTLKGLGHKENDKDKDWRARIKTRDKIPDNMTVRMAIGYIQMRNGSSIRPWLIIDSPAPMNSYVTGNSGAPANNLSKSALPLSS